MGVLVIDYGMGNLGSAARALEECGARAFISDDPRDLKRAERAVIPGVGAFGEAMRRLRERGWYDALHEEVLGKRLPVLGICLGMQLLASEGTEGGLTAGLGLIDGRVVRLAPASSAERVPHVGWNEVHPSGPAPLLEGIAAGSDFYFVHSYHLMPARRECVLATTPYCGGFVSMVADGNVIGTQFHPEKSSRSGLQLIRNFITFGNA